MPVILNVAVPLKGNIEFDFTNKLMTVDTANDLTAQEILNAIREAEAEMVGLSFDQVVKASGKTIVDVSVATGIVNELLGWSIVSGKNSGSFVIKAGTTIKTGVGGLIFAMNNSVSQINILEVNGVVVTVSSGSGLSTEEHDAVIQTADDAKLVRQHTRNKSVANANKTQYKIWNDDETEVVETVTISPDRLTRDIL